MISFDQVVWVPHSTDARLLSHNLRVLQSTPGRSRLVSRVMKRSQERFPSFRHRRSCATQNVVCQKGSRKPVSHFWAKLPITGRTKFTAGALDYHPDKSSLSVCMTFFYDVDQSLGCPQMEGNRPREQAGPAVPAAVAQRDLYAAATVGGLVVVFVGCVAFLLAPVSPVLHTCQRASVARLPRLVSSACGATSRSQNLVLTVTRANTLRCFFPDTGGNPE